MDKLLMKAVFLVVLLLAAGFTGWVSAVEVTGLYRVKIAVADQTESTRRGAALTGFKEVLIRKSGSREVLSVDEVKQAFGKVTSYLQRFEYSSAPPGPDSLPYILQLDFEPRLIDQLIQASGMPIWGSNRPITILWLATEENFQRTVIKESDEVDSFSELVRQNAQRRGIPVILPLMDLEDELNVSISDIWGRFNSTIVTASERYAADSVVTGRVHQVGESWQAKLSYINQDDQKILEFSQPTRELLVETLADRLAELLCQKYCVVEMADSHVIKIQVSGVTSFATFKASQNYLQGMSSIRKVEVDKIAGQTVRYSVALLGDLQSVKDGIELSNRLRVEIKPPKDPFADLNPGDKALKARELNPFNRENRQAPEVSTVTGLENAAGSLSQTESKLAVEPATNEPPTILYYRWIE